MIESLKYVDNAVIFNETNACNLIEFICPAFFVLGSEYKNRIIPENRSANLCGCKMIYFDKNTNISTTQIIEKITSRQD
jgi:bifunctional ADP-heptose synthase (sugar kinase/adenylyltransferase)